MSRRKKLINKIAKKKFDKKCYFCEENRYELLDVHRISPGENDGEYTENNSLTCCSNCHRKIHAGIIKVFRKYLSSRGWILHYIDESSVEHFD